MNIILNIINDTIIKIDDVDYWLRTFENTDKIQGVSLGKNLKEEWTYAEFLNYLEMNKDKHKWLYNEIFNIHAEYLI